MSRVLISIFFLLSTTKLFALDLETSSFAQMKSLYSNYIKRTCALEDCREHKINRFDKCETRTCRINYLEFEEAIIAKCDGDDNKEGCIAFESFFKGVKGVAGTVNYKKDFIETFDEAFPLTKSEDLLLIPTGGHTKNHASILFKTDECDILFAGDVCYNQEQLIVEDLPGINVNYKETKKTFNKIKTYAKNNKLIFLPSHDINSGVRLINKTNLE